MGSKLRKATNKGSLSLDGIYFFYCPACNEQHPMHVPQWSFNGDMERPTFSPSLRVFDHSDINKTKCHLFVKDGVLEYLGDCAHSLAGRAVDMVDIETHE